MAFVLVARMTAKDGEQDRVAELIAFLASDRMTFSTGATFDISGGRAVF